MEYIRNYYKVPAKRGVKINYTGGPNSPVLMEIIGSRGHYLKCKILEGPNAGHKTFLHPTWEIEYLQKETKK